MKFVILSIGLLFSSVSASPSPQFGYQPSTNPVSQLVTQGIQGIQNSLQSVSNAIQNIPRPSFSQAGGFLNPFRPGSQVPVGPNQIPNGPELVPIQTGPIPNGPVPNGPYPNGPFSNGQYPNGPYPNGPVPTGPYPNGPYSNGPIQPVPYEQQVVQIVPNVGPWPYRQADGSERNYPSWFPLPLISQFGEPTIIIISRPPKQPLPQNSAPLNGASQNTSTIQPTNPLSTATSAPLPQNMPVQNPAVPQSMPSTFMPTPGKKLLNSSATMIQQDFLSVFCKVPNTETEPTLGSTTTFLPENASNVPDLGLTMINPNLVPLAPIEIPNTSTQMPVPLSPLQ